MSEGGPNPRGRLAENIVHFARALRAAGLPVGPSRAVDAIRAVEAAGFTRRDDFYWTLHGTLVSRAEHRLIFDQTFHIFWRNPKLLEQMLALMLPELEAEGLRREKAPRRVREALSGGEAPLREGPEEEEIEFDARASASAEERLRAMDFEDMSAAELDEARAMLARLHPSIPERATRRFRADARGPKIAMRASLKASLRGGGDLIHLKRKSRRREPPPLVALCDISGSMSRYSRMFLHFLHALINDRERVHGFLFGTRLTNVTRALRQRDVDEALAAAAALAEDWSGGTRMGETFASFNRLWSRRVLGRGAVVVLMTDGLDRDGGEGLGVEAERLAKSCSRLIWINPLLRFERFEPKSKGVRALLPHVDEFRPAHNVESLAALGAALSDPMAGDLARKYRRMAA